MRKTLLSLLALVVLLIFGGGGWLGYRLVTTGFSAKAEPYRLEVLLAQQLRRLAIPTEQQDRPNPVQPSPTVLQESLAHFADHCAICHANDGSGQNTIGRKVYPQAPDLRQEHTQSLSDGALYFIIQNGIRFTAMPAWGGDGADHDVDSWKLVHFIRHLPKLTQDEIAQMKALNPKTKHQRDKEASSDSHLPGDDSATSDDDHHHH